jgi:DNA-binding transcriptional LysR family regulator
MDSNIGWELYRSLLAVLREGSLSGAARALGIAQPTVGRHITALEETLGLVLFTRTQAGLLPTESALALQVHAQEMETSAAALGRAAASRGQGVTGVVRVTASEVVGVEVLPPIVSALCAAHPGLKIELVLSNRTQDLLQREADIAVRMVRPAQDQLIARHIGHIALGLHATAGYLQRRGTPTSLADLAAHSLIGFDTPTPFIREAAKTLRGLDRDAFTLRSDSDVAQLALIRNGAGIGFCQLPIAARPAQSAAASAQLVRVLPEHYHFKLDTWITMHEGLRNSLSAKATFDALVVGMEKYLQEE